MRSLTRLDDYRPRRRQFAAWAEQEPDLAGLDYAELRTGQLDPRVPAEVRDRRLRALVRLARRDPDALAAAVSWLLPGLGPLVRRYRGSLGEDAWPAAVAELCHVIARHRWEQEPGWLARRLLDAVRSRLRTLARREHAWASATTRPAHERAWGVVDGPDDSTSLLLYDAIRVGVISPETAVLIADTHLDGRPLREAAERLHLDYETAGKRRQRGRAALATWLTDRSAA